jgi:hypothetical protein
MSWSGTVRCGYCSGRGHNKRSCPKIKERIAEDPTGYHAQEARQKARYATPRVCSYCHISGHNKRTCPKISSDRVDTKRKNRVWREKFFAIAKTVGLAQGALVELVNPETITDSYQQQECARLGERYGKLAIVMDFQRSNMNHFRSDDGRYDSYSHSKCMICLFPNGRKYALELPLEFKEISNNQTKTFWKVACGVDGSIKDNFDAEFCSGAYGVDKMLGLD